MIETNKLIAEFMGLAPLLDPETDKYYLDSDLPNYDTWQWEGVYAPEEIQYSKSWDWLMPVVEKIHTKSDTTLFMSPHFRFSIHKEYVTVRYAMEGGKEVKKNYSYRDTGTKLEAVYKAVVEFITWYNDNNGD